MAKPWEKYGSAAPQGSVVQLPEEPGAATKRAIEEARLRLIMKNLNKPDPVVQPNLPSGWRMGPNGVAERIPGLPSTSEATTPKISAKERSTAIQGNTDAEALERIADDLQAKYASGPGATKGLTGLLDYVPTPTNRTFNDTSFQARGLVKRALGFTGGEGNTIGEIQLNYGPYLPEAGDYDEQIVNKIEALRRLANDARTRSVAVLGGVPDKNGKVTPVEEGAPQAPATQPNDPPVFDGRQQGALSTQGGFRDDPALAGAEQKYRQLLSRGAPPNKLIRFLADAGVPLDPDLVNSVRAQSEFRKKNPRVPVEKYDTDMIAKRWNPGSGIVGKVADSALGAYGVSAANALTAGTLDEIVGATGGNQEQAQLAKDMLRQRNPGASLAGDVTGAALGMTGVNAGLRYAGGRMAGLATRGGGIGGDALYGAALGAGENNESRLAGAALGGAAAGAGNLVGRGLVSGAGRVARGVQNQDVGYLAGRGIPMTPGQILGQGGMVGRGLRGVEDAFESIPVIGAGIRQRKAEGLQAFNREAFRDALAPIGGEVQGEIGQEAIGQAQEAVTDAYGNALSGVSLRADMPFIQQAGQHIRAGRQIPKVGEDFDYGVRSEIAPMFGPGRTLDGPGFQEAARSAQGLASDFAKTGGPMGRGAANEMRGIRQSLFDLADRQAPGATPGLLNANTANKNVSILEDAVNQSVNNSVEGGMFTPAQLGRMSVNNTKKFGGKKAAARGDVPFAELQQAGQAVLPNTIPNSGTADRALATWALPAALGGSAVGAEQLGAPTPVVGALAALGGLSTRQGNNIAQRLLLSRDPHMVALGNALIRNNRAGSMFGSGVALPSVFNQ